ncbi:hypothetical protein [Prolixibacter denitrificans]|uniref:Capsular polysaccharide biosynthesis protein n=1 Tax=Prolixibacter denitrificans TaxID=1541063 RepID=A0A2P8CLA0_9BACT|nr:hypothetical protein [Prolixibacter denitrificans]PSK85740.1 hypothetical protein CLV93_101711 [Prolixibacter denitrificans]GET20359.1 hypothetical protein JCM18694_06050 [Prolixibacter denitrificans]
MDNIAQTDRLFQQFLTFEEESQLLEKYRIDGIPLWANCRFAVYHDLLNARGFIGREMGVSTGKLVLLKRQVKRAWSMIRSGKFFRHPGKFPSGVDVMLVDQPRKVHFGERYGCKYSYLWARQSGLKIGVIEPPLLFGDTPHLEPSHLESSTFYTDRLLFAGKWYEMTGLGAQTSEAKRQSVELADRFCDALGVPEKKEYYARFIYKRFLYYRFFRDYWKKLLAKKRPRSVVVVNAYSTENMPLIQAANEIGIITIEIQHGTMGSRHIGYNYPSGEYNFFPRFELIWGNFWRDTSAVPIPKENCYVTGFPFLEKNVGDLSGENQYDVLFISQATIGEQIRTYARELSLKHPEWSVVFKLHPSEIAKAQDYRSYFIGMNITVEYKSDLYEELRKASAVVGVYSTSLFEALAFGLQPVVLSKLYGAGYMGDLIGKGGAVGVYNTDELSDALEKQLSGEQTTVDLNYYFVSNAAEKMEEAVSQILNNAE